MDRLIGKVALISGGGGGIGAATARLFCAEGAKVVLVDQDPAALEAKAGALRSVSASFELDTYVADIADEIQASAAIAKAIERFGAVDVLVNNAAIRIPGTVETTPRSEWDRILSVNLLGAVNLYRAAAVALRKSGKASIINVSSVYAITGRTGMGPYDATKAALIALTRTLACEEAGHGIRVNAVCPGSTLTDYHLKRGAAKGVSEQTMKEEVRTDSLLCRWARPEEIAYPILWLASEEASFVTGAVLMVDGGLSIM
jgi:meso-butanediol dehydrogenase/(S,S)-butanediol dehydrogenase/diacetyl reductase